MDTLWLMFLHTNAIINFDTLQKVILDQGHQFSLSTLTVRDSVRKKPEPRIGLFRGYFQGITSGVLKIKKVHIACNSSCLYYTVGSYLSLKQPRFFYLITARAKKVRTIFIRMKPSSSNFVSTQLIKISTLETNKRFISGQQ